MGGIACVACPWYYPWSYTNEPTCLLIAASLLWLSRSWSYVVAGVLSGYVVAQLVYVFTVIDMTPLQDLRRLLNPRVNILTEWESQHILALIIFNFAAFYLVRHIYRKNASRSTAGVVAQIR